MSFRSRLTTFFLLIVIVPMVGVSALVLRLISDSQQGKINARAAGLASSAQSVYLRAVALDDAYATAVARDAVLTPGPRLPAELRRLLGGGVGLQRIVLSRNGQVIADVGNRTAVAPGTAVAQPAVGGGITVTVSSLTAAEYVRELTTGQGSGLVVDLAGRVVAPAMPAGAGTQTYGESGNVRIGAKTFHYLSLRSLPAFPGQALNVAVLSDTAATASSENSSRIVAAGFIGGFLILAFAFTLLVSRALQGQLNRFLAAARRLAGGDFSAPVPVEGSDDFAMLGAEFNNMSDQLAKRLDEIEQERARLLESIKRIGATFASNLDRRALLELALSTSVDAVRADGGRLTVRRDDTDDYAESRRVGDLTGLQEPFLAAERTALRTNEYGESVNGAASVAAMTLGSVDESAHAHAVISVVRRGGFSDDDRDLLRSLARQTTLALENVQLHVQVSHQAVTDRLTGLSNHGRFQELLAAEIEQVRRYHHPLGLIMVDIDNFKSVNDTYGHQQGDMVLRAVARVLSDSSRDADTAARYGGEELALILPHTDLDGSYAIAERVRTAIAALRIPRLDDRGIFQVTASLGVAATVSGDKDTLIAEADGALYTAKRTGKNRTVRAALLAANVSGGE